MLLEMCRHANSLAHVAEWHIRHYYEKREAIFRTRKTAGSANATRIIKMLQAQTAQQTLKRQDKKHQSFFGLLRAKAAGTYSGPVNPPHYRKEDGYDISGKYIIRRGECMAVPMSRAFRKKHGGDNILSPDPGLDNFMTGVCTDGTTFIIDGRKTKSINQWYNKQKAQRQSDLPERSRWSKFLARITRKRENRLPGLHAQGRE